MSEHTSEQHRAAADDEMSGSRHSNRGATRWVGWIWFAATMMLITGAFNVIEGLVALFKRQYYVVGPESLLVFDLTRWGWIHLIFGGLVVLTGLGLFTGDVRARVAAVILLALDAIAQLVFVTVHPVWSTIVIAFCVIVIWAIVAHGTESTRDGWT